MNARIVRTLHFVAPDAGRRDSRQVRYWRSRPAEERLQETLALHREGNTLFKGGNPPFVYAIGIRRVRNR